LAASREGAVQQSSGALGQRPIRQRKYAATAAGAGAALVLLALACLFTVDTTEQAVITEFGRPVRVVTQPGLEVKYPYHNVRKFDSRLFVYSPAAGEYLTVERTAVVAAGAVVWRIADPRKFFETVADVPGAESRLGDILSAALGAAIGRHPLAAFVSIQPSAYRVESILAEVTRTCRELALRDYGIEVAEVQLRAFDLPKQNRLRLYARMKSERGRLSMKYRAEGEEEGLRLRAAAESEKSRILAEAMQQAQQHHGAGEAAAARIYAEALAAAPDFYRFLRGLEASRKVINDKTTLVLPVDSELFGLLHSSDHYHRAPSSVAGTSP
jgi:modulator of FtsH protease HflC